MLWVPSLEADWRVVFRKVLVRSLRSDLFQKIHSFSFEEASKHEAASLITRITNDSSQLQVFANGLMRIFVKAPILVVGAFIMVSLLSLKLAAILLVVIPLIVLFLYLSLKIAFPYFAKCSKILIEIIQLFESTYQEFEL